MNMKQKWQMKLDRYVSNVRANNSMTYNDSFMLGYEAKQSEATDDSISLVSSQKTQYDPARARREQIYSLFPMFEFKIAEQLYNIRCLKEFGGQPLNGPMNERELLDELLLKYEPLMFQALKRQHDVQEQKISHPLLLPRPNITRTEVPDSSLRNQIMIKRANREQAQPIIEKNQELKEQLLGEKQENYILERRIEELQGRIQDVVNKRVKQLDENDDLESVYYKIKFAQSE